jgi:hypothetical protein
MVEPWVEVMSQVNLGFSTPIPIGLDVFSQSNCSTLVWAVAPKTLENRSTKANRYLISNQFDASENCQ